MNDVSWVSSAWFLSVLSRRGLCENRYWVHTTCVFPRWFSHRQYTENGKDRPSRLQAFQFFRSHSPRDRLVGREVLAGLTLADKSDIIEFSGISGDRLRLFRARRRREAL